MVLFFLATFIVLEHLSGVDFVIRPPFSWNSYRGLEYKGPRKKLGLTVRTFLEC